MSGSRDLDLRPRRRDDDPQRVSSVRKLFGGGVGWDCEAFTRSLDGDLECRRHNSSGLDRFFDEEQRGVVLEDDCPASSDFFPFQESLESFRDEGLVLSISGSNFRRGRP